MIKKLLKKLEKVFILAFGSVVIVRTDENTNCIVYDVYRKFFFFRKFIGSYSSFFIAERRLKKINPDTCLKTENGEIWRSL